MDTSTESEARQVLTEPYPIANVPARKTSLAAGPLFFPFLGKLQVCWVIGVGACPALPFGWLDAAPGIGMFALQFTVLVAALIRCQDALHLPKNSASLTLSRRSMSLSFIKGY
jgi:hypothetical protein